MTIIGKVLKPHGVRGQLKIKHYGESPEEFLTIKRIFVKERIENALKFYIVKSIKPFNRYFIMVLEGIDNLEEAERFRERELFIEKKIFNQLSSGEYFWHQLIGLTVYNAKEEILGKVESILPTKGHDIYVVNKGEAELMIPAVPYFIKEVSVSRKFIKLNSTVDMLE